MARAHVRMVVLATMLLASGASGACSLRSLDYLSAGADEPNAGGMTAAGNGGVGAAGAAGTSGGSASVGAQSGATGSAGTAPSAGSQAVGEAGAAGATGTPEVPDCGDLQRTVDETDIDCGGRTCDPCPADKKCITGTDCQSAICTNQVCQPPTCTDLALNGEETDLNCGGKCPACALGQHCKQDADCSSKRCTEGLCESIVCQDGVLQDSCPLIVDSTPYSLTPAHAPTRCLDDSALSVADGNHMVLWSCKPELQQTFWAIARPDGYFAFRGALSAKCLQVRGASPDAAAVVEQSTCDFAPEQLWKPSRVDATYMQLINKLSNLALDVEGSNVDANGQDIIQGEVDGSADTHWRLQKRSSAAFITLSASDDTSRRMHHEGSVVTLTADDTPSEHWKIVPGLNDPQFVSLQSRDDPGRYLRHAGYRLWCDTNDGSSQFKKDATFHFDNPLVGTNPLNKSFEASNYAAYFLRRSSDTISLVQYADDAGYKSAATWVIGAR